MSEALDDIIEMMEQLLKEYGYQEKQLNKIHGTLSVLEYGYNSLRHELGHAECSASELIEQSGNNLDEHITQMTMKINDISTCLDDACDTLDRIENQVHPCGCGEWRLVIDEKYLHPYNDACPNTWNEFTTAGRQFCARQTNDFTMAVCDSATFTVSGDDYNQVCGRIVGYGEGLNTGFMDASDIDSFPVNGLSLTYGTGPRNHIWTFAIGEIEEATATDVLGVCPCHMDFGGGTPIFVGEDYFCESGNNGLMSDMGHYLDDPLWDGRQCFGECCNSPYFIKTLSNPTSGPLEIRICNIADSNSGNILVERIEIYVQ